MKIRKIDSEDIEFALSQTDSLNWGNTYDEFERLISFEPEGCFIAFEGKEHLGMVTSISYEKVSWIGNLIVVPQFRNRGIGRKLMIKVMNYLKSKVQE